MPTIVWKKPDGGVAITHILPETLATQSEEEHAALLLSRAQEDGAAAASWEPVAYRVIPPTDRSFREAWIWDGDSLAHDIGKCREIVKDRLRQDRAPKLSALDIAYMRADERGDSAGKKAIAAKKQELRDITADPRLAEAATPQELVELQRTLCQL